MRLIWHVFKKDARRLWWEAILTLGLLAWMAHLDRWRSDVIPGFAEAWLNVLLPLAWSFLIGLLVLQDPLVGDREFWPTLPCRWSRMLGAKALFVLLFIHIPYFIAQAAILAARGFQPFAYLPDLLWKQCLLAAAVTLPSIAVAALVRNVIQYVLITVVTTAAVVLLSSFAFPSRPGPYASAGDLIALFTAACGALALLLLQYVRRSALASRILCIAAAACAASLYVWLPRAAVAAAFSPAPSGGGIAVRVAPERQISESLRRSLGGGFGRFAIPIQISGEPQGPIVRYTQASLQIQADGGETFEAWSYSRSDPFRRVRVYPSLWPWNQTPEAQILRLDGGVVNRIANLPVTIEGRLIAEFHNRGAASRRPAGTRSYIPGVGICSTEVLEIALGRQGMRVDCESPLAIPDPTLVTLTDPRTGRTWNHRLGDASRGISYPRITWLSPLNHRGTYFELTTEDQYRNTGSQWLVPQDVLPSAQLEFVPEPVTGYATVDYELRGIELSRYLLPRP